MPKAPTSSHWLLDIDRANQIVGSEEPAIDAKTSIEDAWRIVARSGGMTQAHLAERVAAHFHLAVADLTTAQMHACDLIPEKLGDEHLVYSFRETDHQLAVPPTGGPLR